MPLRLIGLALGPLLLVLLTVSVSARWALVQLIAIYIWLLPLLLTRVGPMRPSPQDRDRRAEWLRAHPVVPFALYTYVFATLAFGLVAFMASVFTPGSPASLGWVLSVTVVIAIALTALVFWGGRTKPGPTT